ETPVMPAPPPHAASEGISTVRLVVAWSLVGLGVAAGVVAGIEGKTAQSRGDSLTTQSKMAGVYEFNPTIEKEGKNANTAFIALAITGGVLAATGVVLLLTGGSSEASAEAAPVSTARATFA